MSRVLEAERSPCWPGWEWPECAKMHQTVRDIWGTSSHAGGLPSQAPGDSQVRARCAGPEWALSVAMRDFTGSLPSSSFPASPPLPLLTPRSSPLSILPPEVASPSGFKHCPWALAPMCPPPPMSLAVWFVSRSSFIKRPEWALGEVSVTLE